MARPRPGPVDDQSYSRIQWWPPHRGVVGGSNNARISARDDAL